VEGLTTLSRTSSCVAIGSVSAQHADSQDNSCNNCVLCTQSRRSNLVARVSWEMLPKIGEPKGSTGNENWQRYLEMPTKVVTLQIIPRFAPNQHYLSQHHQASHCPMFISCAN
jgi:hypothetical protein